MPAPTRTNHIAFQALDMPATHEFWTKAVGLKFSHAVREDARETSSGEKMNPFLHVFYAMPSGEAIAFFDVAGEYERTPDGLEWWAKHVALEVDSVDDVHAMKQQLTEHGVAVRGPVDHDGVWYSIYCFDPNGVHLEVTCQTQAITEAEAVDAEQVYATWMADRAAKRV